MSRLIGYTLGDAVRQAEKDGFEVEKITVTAPPKMQSQEYDYTFRVLRVTVSENKLSILVCKPL